MALYFAHCLALEVAKHPWAVRGKRTGQTSLPSARQLQQQLGWGFCTESREAVPAERRDAERENGVTWRGRCLRLARALLEKGRNRVEEQS